MSAADVLRHIYLHSIFGNCIRPTQLCRYFEWNYHSSPNTMNTSCKLVLRTYYYSSAALPSYFDRTVLLFFSFILFFLLFFKFFLSVILFYYRSWLDTVSWVTGVMNRYTTQHAAIKVRFTFLCLPFYLFLFSSILIIYWIDVIVDSFMSK